MNSISFYIQVIRALEEIGVPYMIVGAFAGLAFGVSRATFDIDILVDLHPRDCKALAAQFPPPRYYADPVMMKNSIRQGILFNLIDTQEGIKADLVPLTREPGYESAFTRRIRQSFTDEDGNVFDAWCAQPTDIIIGKLKAWAEGRSSKHPGDIHDILVFSFSGLSEEEIDLALIATSAAQLGHETQLLWHELIVKARASAKKRRDL
jgi:hypothetical protein